MEIRDGTEKGKGFMEPGNICMTSDSGGGRGWRRRVEIRPWSLLPGFSVCQGQVSAVKSRESYRSPSGQAQEELQVPWWGGEAQPCPIPSSAAALRPQPRQRDAPSRIAHTPATALHSNAPPVVGFWVFPATPTTPSA